jgi:hypothetical protein
MSQCTNEICETEASEHGQNDKNKQTPSPESTSELYRPSDRRLSAKLARTFSDRGCHVVSVTDPYTLLSAF